MPRVEFIDYYFDSSGVLGHVQLGGKNERIARGDAPRFGASRPPVPLLAGYFHRLPGLHGAAAEQCVLHDVAHSGARVQGADAPLDFVRREDLDRRGGVLCPAQTRELFRRAPSAAGLQVLLVVCGDDLAI